MAALLSPKQMAIHLPRMDRGCIRWKEWQGGIPRKVKKPASAHFTSTAIIIQKQECLIIMSGVASRLQILQPVNAPKTKKMKMKSKIFLGTMALSFCIWSCKKANFGDPVILVTGTEVSPIVKFSVENTPATFSVTATATHKAPEDIQVMFEFDSAAVTKYNTEHNTTYSVVPQAAIEISNLSTVIKTGTWTSTPVSVKVISTSPLVDGRSYFIPLTIKTVTGGGVSVLESSSTIFLRIARIINFRGFHEQLDWSYNRFTRYPWQLQRRCLFDPANPVRLPISRLK